MNIYKWRNNFTSVYRNQDEVVRGKLAFKTKETNWLQTEMPVIVLVSIHSSFNDGVGGDLKMDAFLSTIKGQVKGKITVLLSDMAHLRINSLNHQKDLQKTFECCVEDARLLGHRYQSYFEGCDVVYWHSYISRDPQFPLYLDFLKKVYEKNQVFQAHVNSDVKTTYTEERRNKYSEEALYFEKGIEDIFEQCACVMVLANKGYRFQFYPGSPNTSVEYVNRTFISEDKRICWINVFLAIEKKAFSFV